jgi:hypothetical protein
MPFTTFAIDSYPSEGNGQEDLEWSDEAHLVCE